MRSLAEMIRMVMKFKWKCNSFQTLCQVKRGILISYTQQVKTRPPVGTYLLRYNNKNTRTRCEICSNLTIKTHISHLVLVFLSLTLVWNMFKFNNKNTHLTPCSSVSVVNSEHVIAGWVNCYIQRMKAQLLS